MLTAGRHGGLQNMEVRGIVMLRITDPNMAKISIAYDNNDNKGFQMQVCPLKYFKQSFFICHHKVLEIYSSIMCLKFLVSSMYIKFRNMNG